MFEQNYKKLLEQNARLLVGLMLLQQEADGAPFRFSDEKKVIMSDKLAKAISESTLFVAQEYAMKFLQSDFNLVYRESDEKRGEDDKVWAKAALFDETRQLPPFHRVAPFTLFAFETVILRPEIRNNLAQMEQIGLSSAYLSGRLEVPAIFNQFEQVLRANTTPDKEAQPEQPETDSVNEGPPI